MLRLATAVALLIIGWAIWERRLSWRALSADRHATIGCVQTCIALVLFRSQAIADAATWLGVPYVQSVIAAILLMAMGGCQIYAAACRLVPDDQIRLFMHRVDVPAAICAQVMLLLFFASPAPHHHHVKTDLLSVPCDLWLDAYWLVYASITLYMAVFLGWLLVALRRDPRARRAPDLMLVSAAFIGLASTVRIVSVLSGGWFDGHGNVMRYCAVFGFVWGAVATAQSWRHRATVSVD